MALLVHRTEAFQLRRDAVPQSKAWAPLPYLKWTDCQAKCLHRRTQSSPERLMAECQSLPATDRSDGCAGY